MKKLNVVKDMMDCSFVTLKADMPIYNAIEILLNKQLFGACVTDEEQNLVGILSEKECMKLCNKVMTDEDWEVKGETVATYMNTEVETVNVDKSIIDAAHIFLNRDFRRLPVTKGKKLVGQITRRDIVKGLREFDIETR